MRSRSFKINTRFLLLCLLLFSSCGPRQKQISIQDELHLETKMKELLFESVMLMRQDNQEALDGAEASLALARELNPRDPRVADGLGCVFFRKKDYESAKYFFKEALQLDPNYDRAYAHLALLAERDGNYEVAYYLVSKAVQMNPLNYRSRNNMAALLINHFDSEDNLKVAYQELLKTYQSGKGSGDIPVYNLMLLSDRGVK
jgi:tetratricopeptide (TPR) repeat protein